MPRSGGDEDLGTELTDTELVALVRRYRPSSLVPLVSATAARHMTRESWLARGVQGLYAPWVLAEIARIRSRTATPTAIQRRRNIWTRAAPRSTQSETRSWEVGTPTALPRSFYASAASSRSTRRGSCTRCRARRPCSTRHP